MALDDIRAIQRIDAERTMQQLTDDLNKAWHVLHQYVANSPERDEALAALQNIFASVRSLAQMNNEAADALADASRILESTRETITRLMRQRDALLHELDAIDAESHWEEAEAAAHESMVDQVAEYFQIEYSDAEDVLAIFTGENDDIPAERSEMLLAAIQRIANHIRTEESKAS